MSTSNIDLVEIKNFLVEIAQTAGKLIREKSGKVNFDDKKNGKVQEQFTLICYQMNAIEAKLTSNYIFQELTWLPKLTRLSRCL
jgi:hypothetical protein